MHPQPNLLSDEWPCPCGARADDGEELCPKCKARARWLHRKQRVRSAARRVSEQATRQAPRAAVLITLLFGVSGS
jgi:hypothetical protein